MKKALLISVIVLIVVLINALSIRTYTIEGCSMYPLITPESKVICRTQNDYEVGDIIAYISSLTNETVLHRITARNGEYYVLKGDNNLRPDPEKVTKADIVCKAIRIIRNNKTEQKCKLKVIT